MGLALLTAVAGWQLLRGRVADAAGTVVFALLGFSLGWFRLAPQRSPATTPERSKPDTDPPPSPPPTITDRLAAADLEIVPDPDQ